MVYELYNEYTANMLEGTRENMNQLFYSARVNEKIPLLFVHNDDYVNPAIYMMSTEKKYTDTYDIIVMSNPAPELKKQLSISKLPSAIILLQSNDNPDGAQLVQMRFEVSYLNLRQFADQFVKQKKKEEPKPQAQNIEITFVNNNEGFREHCSSKNKPCLVAFLDARENERSVKSLESSLKIIEKVTTSPKGRSFNYIWVNATCQVRIC